MLTYKNTRPTLLQLPDSRVIGPGETFQVSADMLENTGMRIMAEAKFIVPAEATPAPAPAPEPPAKPAPSKADKLAAAAKADEETLLAMADGETDPEVKAALEKRAAELVSKSK